MKTKQQLLSELFLTCIELNDDNFTVFFDYAGHIDRVDIRVCKLGYRTGAIWNITYAINTCKKFNSDCCKSIIESLHKLKSESTAERERLASDAEYKKKKRKEELLKELKELGDD